MAIGPKQKQAREYRGQIPSPGRPTVAWREDRVRFWAAIATGVLTDEASEAAGVSAPVGYRWFRHAGGVNPQLSTTVSGRYLSFVECEDITAVAATLNSRPRKTLGWKTPAEALDDHLRSSQDTGVASTD